MQVFDLLSLHFCCDGYDGGRLREIILERVPVSYASDRTVDVRLVPTGTGSMRVTPYPFDGAPLHVAVMARQMAPREEGAPGRTREAYHQALRLPVPGSSGANRGDLLRRLRSGHLLSGGLHGRRLVDLRLGCDPIAGVRLQPYHAKERS